MLKTTGVRDAATYLLCGLGGFVLLKPFGTIPATFSLEKTFAHDPEKSKRIESWFRKVQADLYRKEADVLDVGLEGYVLEVLFRQCKQEVTIYFSPKSTVKTAQDKSKVSEHYSRIQSR